MRKVISTNLLKKEETFRVMALGQAMNTPVLLIGDPGVAKTASVIDYAKATLGNLDVSDLFILETDEGTKSNAVKGNVDMEKLTTQNSFEINSPITKAKVVVINEIDKASASLRNSLLGIMNERILFNGKEAVNCDWASFIATCNEIPEEEVGSPFWDRFLITHNVERLSTHEIMDYFAKGGKDFRHDVEFDYPTQEALEKVKVDLNKIKICVDAVYEDLSDRAISYFPDLVKNVMVIWGLNMDRSLVKTTELLVGKEKAKELAVQLVPAEIRAIYNEIDKMGQSSNHSDYNASYDRIEALFNKANASNLIDPSTQSDIQARITEEENKLSFLEQNA